MRSHRQAGLTARKVLDAIAAWQRRLQADCDGRRGCGTAVLVGGGPRCRSTHHVVEPRELRMTAQLDYIIDMFKEHLKALSDDRDEVTGKIIISRQMIVRSYALLRLGDKIEADFKP